MVCAHVSAKNPKGAKAEFKKKYTPGMGRKFTNISVKSTNPELNRIVKKTQGKDAYLMYTVCAKVTEI